MLFSVIRALWNSFFSSEASSTFHDSIFFDIAASRAVANPSVNSSASRFVTSLFYRSTSMKISLSKSSSFTSAQKSSFSVSPWKLSYLFCSRCGALSGERHGNTPYSPSRVSARYIFNQRWIAERFFGLPIFLTNPGGSLVSSGDQPYLAQWIPSATSRQDKNDAAMSSADHCDFGCRLVYPGFKLIVIGVE